MTVINEQELRALVQRIADSGVLGRSKTYRAILDYLVDCAIAGEQPKEMAIAVDVLGREADFDVGRDSIVRVHLYHLRNRLDTYFEGAGRDETWRLEIPRGQYVLTAVPNLAAEQDAGTVSGSSEPARESWKAWLSPALAAVLAILLTVSLIMQNPGSTQAPQNPAAGMSPWVDILDDDTPILLVTGDYFIFGELDEAGNVARMVRDFDINSAEDLEMRYLIEPELYERYYNLNLSYVPTGVANAIMEVMPLLEGEGDRLRFRLASDLRASDFTGHHIVYLGYVSGLGLLEEPLFAGSGLSVGQNYDELVAEDGSRYSSNAGLRAFQDDFRDYGLISSFPTPRGHRVVVIAGMRDEGLVALAQESSSAEGVQRLNEVLTEQAIDREAWEMMLEVRGMNHTSFSARPVYSGALRTGRIWGGER